MRISDSRYARDLRRLNLAHRFIRYEVRTGWICALTGLSADRIRKLFRSYAGAARRRRGPSFRHATSILSSVNLRAEASAAGGLAWAMGAVAPNALTFGRRSAYELEHGERICDAFDLYREVIPEARLTLDQLITLVDALNAGQDVELAHCPGCRGTLVIDTTWVGLRLCVACTAGHRRVRAAAPPSTPPASLEAHAPGRIIGPGIQLALSL